MRTPVTERLTTDNEFYRSMIEGIQDYAILRLDRNGTVITWNAGAQRFKGYTADEIIGRSFTAFYTPEDIRANRPAYLLQKAAELGRYEDEGYRIRKDGSRFWADVVITALYDPDGEVTGFTKVTRDLTERRRNEEEMKMYRTMVESVQDYAILQLDIHGNVVTWNAGAQRFKGYAADEIIGKSFSTFYTVDDRAANKPAMLLQQAAELGRIEDEGYRVRKDGTHFWADVVITAIRDASGQLIGYSKVTRDLTERRRNEENLRHRAIELEAARNQAEKSERVKSAFLASMSHELRTPLNAIINFTQFVVSGDMGEVNAEQKELLTDVVHSGKHLLSLINDVLDMSKIESGALTLFVQDGMKIGSVIESAVATCRALVKPGVLLSIEVPDSLPAIRADRLRVLQILLNILSNACKFTTVGSIAVRSWNDDQNVYTSIADTGPGIAAEDQAGVFSAFVQTETGLRQEGGTGLGMPIARNLAEAHGGSLSLESAVGNGTTFTLRLPIMPAGLEPVRTNKQS